MSPIKKSKGSKSSKKSEGGKKSPAKAKGRGGRTSPAKMSAVLECLENKSKIFRMLTGRPFGRPSKRPPDSLF